MQSKRKEPKPFFRTATRAWYVQIGKRQVNLGRDKAAAWEEYHRLMAERKDVEATSDCSVCAVLDAYLDWVKDWRAAGTYQWYAEHLNKFAQFIGPKLKLLDLRERHVTKWIDERHKKAAPDTIYGAIRAVQRAMNWAVKRGYLPSNPVKGVEKPRQQPREAVITPKQFEEILSRCTDQSARDLFTVLWETGCRVEEIRRVEASNFNQNERCWQFTRAHSKGRRIPRTVYLTDTAFEITQRLAGQNPEGPMFRNRQGKPWTKNAIVLRFRKFSTHSPKKCLCGTIAAAYIRGPHVPAEEKRGRQRRYVCDSCIKAKALSPSMLGAIPQPIQGLQDAVPTSFRHSFVTRALKSRVAGITVSVLMGHADTRMISRVYGHLEKHPEFLREELGRVKSEDA